ncbi:hypothetical protein V6N13_078496 [Hibiscus sabdariffa]
MELGYRQLIIEFDSADVLRLIEQRNTNGAPSTIIHSIHLLCDLDWRFDFSKKGRRLKHRYGTRPVDTDNLQWLIEARSEVFCLQHNQKENLRQHLAMARSCGFEHRHNHAVREQIGSQSSPSEIEGRHRKLDRVRSIEWQQVYQQWKFIELF